VTVLDTVVHIDVASAGMGEVIAGKAISLGTPGSSSRRFFHGPGMFNTDLALLKSFRLAATKTLQFRLETFNVFNHTQFFGPTAVNGDFSSAQFGQVVKAAPPRVSWIAEPFLSFQYDTRPFTDRPARCENDVMQKLLTTSLTMLAAGLTLIANVRAQQTPNPQQAPAPKAQSAPAAKAQNGPAAKTGQTNGTESQNPVTLKTQKDKVSYAIGLNIGKSLHRDSVDVDQNILVRGLRDGMAAGKTLLTDDEAKAAMTELQNDMRKKQEEKAQVAGEANKKEGEEFLATNKTKDGVVTLSSGLQYKILTPGTGAKPAASDSVVCNYRGTLLDGKEFDSSYKRGQPATFPVGGVIKGWTEALQLMPVGSKWQLFVPSELAYGQRGAGADIGPNATLVFEVELLSIQAKDAK
jgi:FKBP-type peptidyl-prolyl cis-trans isomerase FklB